MTFREGFANKDWWEIIQGMTFDSRRLGPVIVKLIINEILPRQKRGLTVPSPNTLWHIAWLKAEGLITHADARWLIAEVTW